MPEQTFTWSAFRDLDASWDPEGSVAWLERAAALPAFRAGKQRSYELLEVGPGDRILDVGCGSGDDALALWAAVSPGGAVVGVDTSACAVQSAREAAAAADADGARFEVADATQLPFEPGAFDACRCDRTLLHVPDAHRALAEMARVVRPAGRLLVSEARVRPVSELQDDLDLLDGFLARFALESGQPMAWIGLMLPVLLDRSELQELHREVVTGELSDPDSVTSYYDLHRLCRRAVAHGELSAGAAERFLDQVHGAVAAGRLSVVVETHLYAGRVPGD